MAERDEKVINFMTKASAISVAIGAFIVTFLTKLFQIVLSTGLVLLVMFLLIWTYAFFTGDVGYNINVNAFPRS